MKIEEIFKIVQEGKTVKFNEGIYRMEGIWLVRIFKGKKTELFSTTHMNENNFKIVEEEKKILSDKGIGFDTYGGGSNRTYQESDVKQFIKDIKGDIKKYLTANKYLTIKEIEETINKRAGERLV